MQKGEENVTRGKDGEQTLTDELMENRAGTYSAEQKKKRASKKRTLKKNFNQAFVQRILIYAKTTFPVRQCKLHLQWLQDCTSL